MVCRMNLGFFLSFLLLFHLLPPRLGQKYPYSACPQNFYCQNIGLSEFSFNASQPHSCGLCMAICDTDARSLPKIKLAPSSDKWFDVVKVLENSVIKLRDPMLQNLLLSHNCSSFFYNMNTPNLDSISYKIVSNFTLIFKCLKNPDHSQERDAHFRFHDYSKTEPCEDFDIYYGGPKSYVAQYPSDPAVHPLPSGCSPAGRLPVLSMDIVSDDRDLFNLLTAEFDLQLGGCNELCHHKEMEEHVCHIEGQGKKNKKKVIIGTCVAGGALLMVLATILILYKKGKWINFHQKNSSEPSSKLDLEGGSTVYFGVPVFSYSELEEVTNNFDVSKELGSGGFGTVYYGKLCDGREVAVKRLYEHSFKRMAQFLNEVEILTRLRHPNLVSLYGCTSRRCRELLLVYEYIPNGTVADHLYGNRANDQSLTWPVRMNIAIETAGALAYLHASDIIHRDVKTNNILLDHNFQVKVADFGLSRLFPNDVSHVSTAPQGTPGYVDPEYHQCYQLTDKSDVYSFGVVLIELISSMPAVDISRHRHEINLANLAINRIQRRAFNELIDSSLGYESDPEIMRMTTSVAELAFRCLQLEKEMRPTMDEVLETLKAIRDCNESDVEKANETSENTAETKSRMNPASPESDDVVLLRKHTKFPSSPNSVTDIWVSGSTTTSSSR